MAFRKRVKYLCRPQRQSPVRRRRVDGKQHGFLSAGFASRSFQAISQRFGEERRRRRILRGEWRKKSSIGRVNEGCLLSDVRRSPAVNDAPAIRFPSQHCKGNCIAKSGVPRRMTGEAGDPDAT